MPAVAVSNTAQKMKFSVWGFFSKRDQIRRKTFNGESLNRKLHFLWSEYCKLHRGLKFDFICLSHFIYFKGHVLGITMDLFFAVFLAPISLG